MDHPSRARVRATYDRIAESFAQTRRAPWPEVVSLLGDVPPGSRVLDLGSGNGRHAVALAHRGLRVLALDFSRPLVFIGRRDNAGRSDAGQIEWLVGDAIRVPLRGSTVQACTCVAVLHHLPSREERLATLREIRRVLVPGGPVVLSVWDRDHPRLRDVPPDARDVEVPWTLPGGVQVPRYYHLFDLEELRSIIIESGLQGETFLRGSGNIFALARRHG